MIRNMAHVNPTRQNPSLCIAAGATSILWGGLVIYIWVRYGWVLSGQDPGAATFSPQMPWKQLTGLLAVGLFTVCALGFGLVAGRILGILPTRGFSRYAVGLLIGHVLSGVVVFAMGVLHLYPWGLLLLLVGAAGLKGEFGLQRPCVQTDRREAWAILFVVLFLAAALLAFVVALAPVTESDGIRYQLVGPQEWLKAGGLVHLPYQAFTNLPAQTNLLYLALMTIANPRAAQLLHWTYLPVIFIFAQLLSRQLIRSLLASSRTRGTALCMGTWPLASAVAAVTSPVILVLSSWPFIDLSTLAYSLGAIWSLMPGSLRRLESRLLLCGVFCGAAIATKLTALITVFIIALVVLVVIAVRSQKIRRLSLYALPVIIITMPWFIKSTIYHQNPIYPAGYSLFGGSEWNEVDDEIYKNAAGSKGFGTSVSALFMSPVNVTLKWKHFEAHNPGPALLFMLPIALIGLLFFIARSRKSPVLWIILLQILFGWLAWYFTYQSVRFLMLQIVLAVLSGGAVLYVVSRRTKVLRSVSLGLMLLLAGSGVAWQYFYFLVQSPKRPVAAAIGLIDEETYLSTNLNFYDAVQWLNTEVAEGEKVFYIGEHRAMYSQYEVIHSDWFDTPRILTAIRNTKSNEALLNRWRDDNVRYILWNYDELRLYEEQAFKPRFNEQEWQRYLELRDELLTAEHIVFSPHDRVFIVELN